MNSGQLDRVAGIGVTDRPGNRSKVKFFIPAEEQPDKKYYHDGTLFRMASQRNHPVREKELLTWSGNVDSDGRRTGDFRGPEIGMTTVIQRELNFSGTSFFANENKLPLFG